MALRREGRKGDVIGFEYLRDGIMVMLKLVLRTEVLPFQGPYDFTLKMQCPLSRFGDFPLQGLTVFPPRSILTEIVTRQGAA